MNDKCTNCGTTREQLKARTGRGFSIVGLHEAEDCQWCGWECLRAWIKEGEK